MSEPVPSLSALSAEHLEAIGRIACSWSHVEAEIEHAIWILAGLPSTLGRAITTHIGIESRLDIMLSLANTRIEDEHTISLFNSFAKRVRGIRPMRNDIVHGIYYEDDNDLVLQKYAARGKIKRVDAVVELETLQKFAKEVDKCAEDMMVFLLIHLVQQQPEPPP